MWLARVPPLLAISSGELGIQMFLLHLPCGWNNHLCFLHQLWSGERVYHSLSLAKCFLRNLLSTHSKHGSKVCSYCSELSCSPVLACCIGQSHTSSWKLCTEGADTDPVRAGWQPGTFTAWSPTFFFNVTPRKGD